MSTKKETSESTEPKKTKAAKKAVADDAPPIPPHSTFDGELTKEVQEQIRLARTAS
jgi:hypothetical protein